MRRTFKYRIYLTNGQRRILEQQLEECRWVYNETLATRKHAYEERGESLSRFATNLRLPFWKVVRPSLKLVHSQVLQNVQLRVDLAFQSYFRRVKEGAAEVGYPRFKQFGRYDSITYPQYGNGVGIRGQDVVLSKVGRVQVVWHRSMEGTPKTVTLVRSRTSKWYVSFSCEARSHPLPYVESAVGVDVGLESFLTTSDGNKVPNPRFFRRDEKELARVQRLKDAAKAAQDWPENKKRKKAIARIHERIAWRRDDFAHQISRVLVNQHLVIAFEALEPQQMGRTKGRGMRKSIADVAWTKLIDFTSAKAEDAGRTVVLVNPRNTSKMCSSCGKLVPKGLGERVHRCPHCGLTMDRDQNAAINILRLGLDCLRQEFEL